MPPLRPRLERLAASLGAEQASACKPYRTFFSYAPRPGHPPGPGETTDEEAAAEAEAFGRAEGAKVIHVRFVQGPPEGSRRPDLNREGGEASRSHPEPPCPETPART